eukprot:scaffold7193_cov129-Ochromonas_danica.AAC.1
MEMAAAYSMRRPIVSASFRKSFILELKVIGITTQGMLLLFWTYFLKPVVSGKRAIKVLFPEPGAAGRQMSELNYRLGKNNELYRLGPP